MHFCSCVPFYACHHAFDLPSEQTFDDASQESGGKRSRISNWWQGSRHGSRPHYNGGNILRYLIFLATCILYKWKILVNEAAIGWHLTIEFCNGMHAIRSTKHTVYVICAKYAHYMCTGRTPIEITCFIYGFCHGPIYNIPQMLVWSFLKAICSGIYII